MSERLSDVLSRWWNGTPNRPATRRDLAAARQEIMRALERLGIQVSEVTDALADLNDATNEVAGELDTATATIQSLSDQLAATDPAAAAKVAEAVSGITAAATRLRGLAADPEQPVPPVDETPVEPPKE